MPYQQVDIKGALYVVAVRTMWRKLTGASTVLDDIFGVDEEAASFAAKWGKK